MEAIHYKIRPIREDDFSQVIALRSENGSLDVVSTYHTWLQIDPLGILVAASDTGEILGLCSSIIHHNDLAFTGKYAVRKKYQGLGIGFKLWTACLDHIGTRNACLSAYLDKANKYRLKGGFPITESEWSILLYATLQIVDPHLLSDSIPNSIKILSYVQEEHLQAISDYDCTVLDYRRNMVLELIFKEAGSKTFVAIRGAICVGFGSIRMCCNGCARVGPLYADETAVAEGLLKVLIGAMPEAKGLEARSTTDNIAMRDLMLKLHVPVVGELFRLYKGKPYRVNNKKIFAHTDIGFAPF